MSPWWRGGMPQTVRAAVSLGAIMLMFALPRGVAQTASDTPEPSSQAPTRDMHSNGQQHDYPAQTTDGQGEAHALLGGRPPGSHQDEKTNGPDNHANRQESPDGRPSISQRVVGGLDAATISSALTVLLTGLLVVVGWGQVRISRKQAKIMATQAELTRRQIDEARELAAYQLEEARTAGIRTHRPRLYVRNIQATHGFRSNEPMSLQLTIANKGSWQAHIAIAQCVLIVNVNFLPASVIYEPDEILHPDNTTVQGGSSTIAWLRSTKGYFSDSVYRPGDPEGSHIYCIGKIRYTDDAGVGHTTGFCRRYVRRDGQARFYPVDDPDYEYEE